MPAKRSKKSETAQPSEVRTTNPSTLHEEEELIILPAVEKRPKMERIQTTYTEEQKNEIIEFLKMNPIIYEKQRADFKNTKLKEEVWEMQAENMGTSVKNLQTYYSSMRTRIGRLKQIVNKSEQAIEGFSTTELWIWENFQFLMPHISAIAKPRKNAASLKAKYISAAASPSIEIFSTDTETEIPDLVKLLPTPPITAKKNTEAENDNTALGLFLKESLKKQSTAETLPSVSYFALYVENTLKLMPGSIRRDAEFRILQVLHDCEDKMERQKTIQDIQPS